ncbi:MAG: hypothetical protein GWO20_13685, partial [Candidatus Korarchaeota archaeon]|nr:hypothetical protein [Candidatus Korarchaeota archaeon]
MRRNAIVSLPFASEKHSKAASRALQPEALNPPT